MYHFFVKPEQISDKKAIITGPDVNHIKNVLRMKPGEDILISNGEDWDYLCTIDAIEKDEIILKIISENESLKELPGKITLYQGLPKSDKMEMIIQKAVELGVSRIVPVITKRVIVKLDDKKSDSRIKRWQAIAESAAKQSKRSIIPIVSEPLKYMDAIAEGALNDKKFVPYEHACDMEKTRKLIADIKSGENIAVFIGPEGGFEDREIEAAISCGVEPITLGRRILRTETAGITILSVIMMHLEE